jgi:hypothetical protein
MPVILSEWRPQAGTNRRTSSGSARHSLPECPSEHQEILRLARRTRSLRMTGIMQEAEC